MMLQCNAKVNYNLAITCQEDKFLTLADFSKQIYYYNMELYDCTNQAIRLRNISLTNNNESKIKPVKTR